MVHPAPRMTTAPTPKRPSIENNGPGGNSACAAARVMLHATKVRTRTTYGMLREGGKTTWPIEEPGTDGGVETG